MVQFIPAAKLKQEFGVFGHFYSVIFKSGDLIDCRSVLEIVAKNKIPIKTDKLLNSKPDVVFIMMNPGSSVPLEKVNNIVSAEKIINLKISLVLTKPDTTQYQVMRVMKYCNYLHARVLNISDMRNPKSNKFIRHYTDIENNTGFIEHSLFTEKRKHELKTKLNIQSEVPIVCAWGVNSDLDPLIERCWSKINKLSGLTGYLKSDTKNKFFHPLPTLQKDKEKWLDKMVDIIMRQRDRSFL